MLGIQSIDPTSGEVMASYEAMLPETVKNTVDQVHEAFLAWRQTTFAERCTLMHKAAHVLRTNAADYARTVLSLRNNVDRATQIYERVLGRNRMLN